MHIPTIIDVAREAGVSIATVSNYINNTKPVSVDKKNHIAEAIEKLNYIPNFSAKNLKSSCNRDIGVILPNLNDSYYIQILQGIENYMRQNDYFVNITVSNENPEIESGIINNFLNKQVSGIILISCQPENSDYFYQNIIKNNKPFVHIDRRIKEIDANFLYFENVETLYNLTGMYFKRGYRKIAILAGPELYSCERDAINGYLKALAEYGIEKNQNYIWNSILTKEAAFMAATEILKKSKPDVIITTSGNNAAGVMESLLLTGYSVPDDVIVASLGEDTWSVNSSNRNIFSTVRPSIILGKMAAELLHKQIEAPVTFECQTTRLNDRFNNCNDKCFTNTSRAGLSTGNMVAKAKVFTETDTDKDKGLRIILLETPQTESFTGLLPNFENSTGTKISITRIPYQKYLDYIFEEQKSGKTSDVYMVDMPWLYMLAEEKIITDISEYTDLPDFSREAYLPNCLKYLSEFKGRYYGLPFICIPQVLYYRKDLFNSRQLRNTFENKFKTKLCPPRTWTEYNVTASFFTRRINPHSPVEFGTSVPSAYRECLAPELLIRLWAYGSNIYDDNYRITFNNPQTFKAYLHFIKVFEYCPPDYFRKDTTDVINDFLNERTAMFVAFPTSLSNVVNLEKICMSNNLGYTYIPGRCPILGGWSMCIPEKSTKKASAFKFINWACGSEIANYLTLLTGQSVISSSNENDELINLYPWLPLYNEVYKYARPVVPPYAEGRKIIPQTDMDEILYQSVKSILNDNVQISDTIQAAHGKFENLFRVYGYNTGFTKGK